MKISKCIKELTKIQNLKGDIEIGLDTGIGFAYLESMHDIIYYPDNGIEIPIISMNFE